MIDPYVPVTADPTEPLALPTVPAATPTTVKLVPVSLVSTFPVGFVPEVPLLTPPASTAVAVSAVAVPCVTRLSPVMVQV